VYIFAKTASSVRTTFPLWRLKGGKESFKLLRQLDKKLLSIHIALQCSQSFFFAKSSECLFIERTRGIISVILRFFHIPRLSHFINKIHTSHTYCRSRFKSVTLAHEKFERASFECRCANFILYMMCTFFQQYSEHSRLFSVAF